MANKKLQLTTVLIFGMILETILFFVSTPFALAQEAAPETATTSNTNDPCAKDTPITCTNFTTNDISACWVVVVLEEQFGNQTKAVNSNNNQNTSFQCLRVTQAKTTPSKPGEPIEKESHYTELGTCPENATCQRVQIIASKNGGNILFTYISAIYKWAAGVIGIFSVLYLVLGGFQVSMAQDNAEELNKAKKKIMQSIAGLVLLFMSGIILYTINPNFFTS